MTKKEKENTYSKFWVFIWRTSHSFTDAQLIHCNLGRAANTCMVQRFHFNYGCALNLS